MRTAISTVASSKSNREQLRLGFEQHANNFLPVLFISNLGPWCYDRLGAHPGGVKLVNLTSSHLARKMARRDKRHRRSGRPVVQHDIQKTRFIKNLKRGRPACEATAEGCTPEEMERWAGIS